MLFTGLGHLVVEFAEDCSLILLLGTLEVMSQGSVPPSGADFRARGAQCHLGGALQVVGLGTPLQGITSNVLGRGQVFVKLSNSSKGISVFFGFFILVCLAAVLQCLQ